MNPLKSVTGYAIVQTVDGCLLPDAPNPYAKYVKAIVVTVTTQSKYGGKVCPTSTKTSEICWCPPGDASYEQCVAALALSYPPEDGVSYGYSPLGLVLGVSLWQCINKCADTTNCVGYYFVRGGGGSGSCYYYKQRIGGSSSQPSVVTGLIRNPKLSL